MDQFGKTSDRRSLVLVTSASAACYAARGTLETALPLYAQVTLGYSAAQFGSVDAAKFMVTALIVAASGYLSRIIDVKKLCLAFMFFTGILFGGLDLMPSFCFVPMVLVAGGCVEASLVQVTALVQIEAARGSTPAWTNTISRTGGLIAQSVLIGGMADTFGTGLPFYATAVALGLGCIASNSIGCDANLQDERRGQDQSNSPQQPLWKHWRVLVFMFTTQILTATDAVAKTLLAFKLTDELKEPPQFVARVVSVVPVVALVAGLTVGRRLDQLQLKHCFCVFFIMDAIAMMSLSVVRVSAWSVACIFCWHFIVVRTAAVPASMWVYRSVGRRRVGEALAIQRIIGALVKVMLSSLTTYAMFLGGGFTTLAFTFSGTSVAVLGAIFCGLCKEPLIVKHH